jgi:hypothetical protein
VECWKLVVLDRYSVFVTALFKFIVCKSILMSSEVSGWMKSYRDFYRQVGGLLREGQNIWKGGAPDAVKVMTIQKRMRKIESDVQKLIQQSENLELSQQERIVKTSQSTDLLEKLKVSRSSSNALFFSCSITR